MYGGSIIWMFFLYGMVTIAKRKEKNAMRLSLLVNNGGKKVFSRYYNYF
jgi:hypothetical protein